MCIVAARVQSGQESNVHGCVYAVDGRQLSGDRQVRPARGARLAVRRLRRGQSGRLEQVSRQRAGHRADRRGRRQADLL